MQHDTTIVRSPHWASYMNPKNEKKKHCSIPKDANQDNRILQPSGTESKYYSNENIQRNLIEPNSKIQFPDNKLDQKKASHKRKASANVPYQFPTSVRNMGVETSRPTQKNQVNISKIQCCPELQGDIDEVMIEGPSPPKSKHHKTPVSQDTNETSNVTSHKKRGMENSMQSEDSIGFLECSESLGNDKSSSSSGIDGVLPLPQAKDTPTKQENSQNDFSQERVLDTELNAVLNLDTLNYLVGREIKYKPDPYYMEKNQPQITWKMRMILVDWMMEVCMEYKLKRETFHYAVNYVDRYLSLTRNIDKSSLQLIGVTSMYIASKIEELFAPRVGDFAKSTDNGYSTEQILEMESKIMIVIIINTLTLIVFKMGTDSPYIKHVGKLVYEPMGYLYPAMSFCIKSSFLTFCF